MTFILIILPLNFGIFVKQNIPIKFRLRQKNKVEQTISVKKKYMHKDADLRIQQSRYLRTILKTPYTRDKNFHECSQAPTLLNTHHSHGKLLHTGRNIMRPNRLNIHVSMYFYLVFESDYLVYKR